jgi:hypothetical protein
LNSGFTESKPRSESALNAATFLVPTAKVETIVVNEVKNVIVNQIEKQAVNKVKNQLVKGETEIVQRAMVKKELEATEKTGLVRGGREGTHHVSDAIGNDAKKVRQRLALDNTPEVKVDLEVPKGSFSNPTRVKATETMPGGGMERKATGNIPAKVVKVKELKNTGN